MMGVESDEDPCSGEADTGLVVEVMPDEGAGVGANEVAASERADEVSGKGSGGMNAGQSQVDWILGATAVLKYCRVGFCSKPTQISFQPRSFPEPRAVRTRPHERLIQLLV